MGEKEKAIADRRKEIVKQSLQKRHEQNAKTDADLRTFTLNEKTVLGKLQNRMKAIDLQALVGLGSGSREDGRARMISEVFGVMSSTGKALQTIKATHQLKNRQINHDEKSDVRTSVAEEKKAYGVKMSEHRHTVQRDRFDLIQRQRGEIAKTRSEWKTLEATRSRQWDALSRKKHPRLKARCPSPKTR